MSRDCWYKRAASSPRPTALHQIPELVVADAEVALVVRAVGLRGRQRPADVEGLLVQAGGFLATPDRAHQIPELVVADAEVALVVRAVGLRGRQRPGDVEGLLVQAGGFLATPDRAHQIPELL